MTGCAACDEWVQELAARSEHPTGPAVRRCPACGRTGVAYDIRPSEDPEVDVDTVTPERQHARDAQGRIGEVMGYTHRNTRAWLRKPGGGREWDVAADSITYVDTDGVPLPKDPS